MDLLQSQFVGMHELRTNLPRVLDALCQEGTELVVTRQGKPTAVMLSLDHYLEIQEALRELSEPAYLRSLFEAHDEIQHGKGVPAEEVFQHSRRAVPVSRGKPSNPLRHRRR